MKTPSVNIVRASSILEDWKSLGLTRKVYGFMRPDAPIADINAGNIEKAVLEASEKIRAAEALNNAYKFGPTALIEPKVEIIPQVEYFKY